MFLKEVDLGYLKLGQSTLTLSGGECQRIKLSRELSREDLSNTIYILASDFIVDLGPGGGRDGGVIVATGSVDELVKSNAGYTGRYLKKFIGAYQVTTQSLGVL